MDIIITLGVALFIIGIGLLLIPFYALGIGMSGLGFIILMIRLATYIFKGKSKIYKGER